MKQCLRGPALILAALGAGCANPSATKPYAPGAPVAIAPDAHDPPFATAPFEPISREAVIAIALREWRLWGNRVDDDPPGTRPPPLPQDKPERWPGFWQRVGEYWWLGMNAGTLESAWTGKHDASGQAFPANQDGNFAWSAAFISYVMRIAGAGDAFPYAEAHSTYIDVAKEMATGQVTGYIITARRPTDYAPQPGDLICEARGRRAESITYDNLPLDRFPGHCDIVVAAVPNQLTVVGGNVDDAVTMKHVPTTPDGKLATPDGTILDTRYPWMVVIKVLYPPGTAPIS